MCFQTLFGNGGGGGGGGGNPYITTSAAMATDKNYLACQTALEVISICESLSTGFDDLPATLQAPCMCYSSKSWVPQFFDNAFSSCIAYTSTADTSDYPDLVSDAGFCKSVGNILAAPASGTVALTMGQNTATGSVGGGSITPTTTATPAATPDSGTATTPTSTAAKATSSSGAGLNVSPQSISAVSAC
jgi:hypothetical protein